MNQTERKETPLLSVKNLYKKYKDFRLENINLQLAPGMIMGFMGRNGAGKSTTIQAVMDLIKPDAGEIDLIGMKMSENEVAIKDRIGYVSDTPILNSGWTARYTLDFVRPFYSMWDRELEKKYLKEFDIPMDKKIAKLSKGMKVKLSILLAICHHPKLLLLDEPTSGLDPVVREEILELMLQYLQEDESRSILFSSHITSDVEKIADIVTFIDKGKILLSEEKETLQDRFRRIVIFGENAQDIAKDPDLMKVTATKGGYIGYTGDYTAFAKRNKNSGSWHDERLALEELFLVLTGGEIK